MSQCYLKLSEENPMESAANITLVLAEMCYAKASQLSYVTKMFT